VKPGNGGSLTKFVSRKEKKLPALRKVTLDAGWINVIVAQHEPSFNNVVPRSYKHHISNFMYAYRCEPAPAEFTETATDEFHISRILRPAKVAAAILDEKYLTVGFPRMVNNTKSDISVYTPLTKDEKERLHWTSIEDKRLEVFLAHLDEFCSYSDQDVFPWPANADEFDKATSGKRMWIQVFVLPLMPQHERSFTCGRYGAKCMNTKSITAKFSRSAV
jgi:hypothetical protein